jgi:SAM-dependent methyltransferase
VSDTIRLNLGSANRPMPGFVNLDMQELPGVDKVYRVDPWWPQLPFDDDSVSEIYANNFVEHIADTNTLIQEMWRVSVDGATWYILTPGYRDPNSWNDPTHFSHWGDKILEFYTAEGFDQRRYEPALLTYRLVGDVDHGLEFFVTAQKPGGRT